ncbi:MAG TPA: hypothetical protein V6D19_06670 [Stenomitos sp.]
MGIRRQVYSYADNFPPVWATQLGVRSPRGVDLDPALFSAYAGADGMTQEICPPGAFAAAVPGSTKFRVLPRTRLTAASATNSPTLNVSKHTAQFFIAGDTLTVAGQSTTITLANAWVAGETLTITVEGRSWVYTVPNPAPASLTLLAADIAAKLRQSSLNDLVEVVPGVGILLLISLRDVAAAFTVAETSSSGTALPSSGNFAAGASLGTVQSVTYNPNTDTHQITLSGNAATALPIGTPVGDMRYSPAGLGLMSPGVAIDLLREPNTYQACFTAMSVYRDRLPYWDGQLSRLFPEITLV